MSETAIREKIYRNLYIHHDKGKFALNELAIDSGNVRADVVYFERDCITGYEIKSENDNLNRLPRQMEAYFKTFQRVIVVAATKHIEPIKAMVCDGALKDYPQLGLTEYRDDGSYYYHADSLMNFRPTKQGMAKLLWKSECEMLLKNNGFIISRRATRNELQQGVSEWLSGRCIIEGLGKCILNRKGGRYEH